MKHILFPALAAAVLPFAVPAVAATKPVAAKAPPPAPVVLTPGTRKVVLSPEGNAIAAKISATRDPRLTQIPGELAAVRQQKAQFLTGTSVDVDALEPLMRKEEALLAELKSKQDDLLLSMLRALSDSDRVALLQNLAGSARPQDSRPAETGR